MNKHYDISKYTESANFTDEYVAKEYDVCEECGSVLLEGETFCIICGAPVETLDEDEEDDYDCEYEEDCLDELDFEDNDD